MKMFKKIILKVLLVIFFILMIYSSKEIYNWYIDNKNIEKEVKNINKKVKEIEEQNLEEIIYDDSKFLNVKFLSKDLTDLEEINKELIGWIEIPSTNINYPFVKHTDNNYYLNHSFTKKNNEAGWLFLDYRNDLENDQNSIIYAHGRLDKSMFGSLKDTLSNKWLQEEHNHIVKISTKKANYIYEVFSVYHIETTDDYLTTNYDDSDAYSNFLNKIKNRSLYDFTTNITEKNKILTLSTCYNDKEKMVLHAKLIKKQIRK